jgi:hypothetical protein
VQRFTINHWVYRGKNPPIETILTVLTRLNAPLTDLLDSCRKRGVAVPDLMGPEPGAAKHAGAPSPQEAADRAARAAQRAAEEWAEMIALTRRSMEIGGFPETMIAMTIATIEAKRDNTDPMARHVLAEHDPRSAPTSATPLTERSRQDYQETLQYGRPEGGANTAATSSHYRQGAGPGGAGGATRTGTEPHERHSSNPKNR